MELTEAQQQRYARHLILKEVGIEGQKKILNAKVLVIGTGGLGSPAILYLAAAGVGTLGIVDADVLDLSNLQRQVIHKTKYLNTPKVESAKKAIEELNPDVKVVTYNEFVTSKNIASIIKDYDFILDCTDNFPSKFLINDACVLNKKPFCHAGILRFHGQLMTYVPGQGPCYRCVFKEIPKKGEIPTVKQIGLLGAVPGVIGTLQAMEALKFITGAGKLLTGYLLTYDGLNQEFKKIKLPSNTDNCDVCGKQPIIKTLDDTEYKLG